jgi:hypothetical protein
MPYNWHLYYNFTGLLIWLLLVILLLAPKTNRKPAAFLIIIPIIVLWLLWILLKSAMSFPSEIAVIFEIPLSALFVGLAAVMLLMHALAKTNRVAAFFITIAILWFTWLISCISFGFSLYTVASAILYAVATSIIMFSILVTSFICRKSYSHFRFMFIHTVSTLILAQLVMLVYFAFVLVAMTVGSAEIDFFEMLGQILLAGLIFAGILYVIQMAFLISILSTRFYRTRFYNCFRLKGMEFVSPKVPASVPDHVMLTKAAEKDDDTENKVSNKWMDPPRPKD